MAKAKRVEFEKYVSPVIMAKWPWLDKPQPGFKEGDKAKFKIRCLMEDTEENREWCQKIIDKALAEAKTHNIKLKKVYHNPFIMPEDIDEDDFLAEGDKSPKYDEDHRDKIIFNCSTQYPPGQVDTARKSLPADVKIFSGDEVRVKFEATPYVNGAQSGITLRLLTAQLVAKNANFTGTRAPDLDGFDEIEGYVADEGDEGVEDF